MRKKTIVSTQEIEISDFELKLLESFIQQNITAASGHFEGGINCNPGPGGITTIKIFGPSDMVQELTDKVMNFIEAEERLQKSTNLKQPN